MSRRGALASAWLVALVLAACSATNKPGTSGPPPTEPAAAGGAGGSDAMSPKAEAEPPAHADPGEELEVLHALVDTAWAELEELDDEREKAAATEPNAAASSRCDRIRGLADEICTLSDRMCTLATEHPGQPRYAEACTRSGETCRRARQAAERCPAV